jgi:hypothetical protein
MVLLLGMGIQTCLEHLYRGSEAVLTLLDCLVFDLEFYLCCFLFPTLGLLIWVVNEVLQCGSIDLAMHEVILQEFSSSHLPWGISRFIGCNCVPSLSLALLSLTHIYTLALLHTYTPFWDR